METWQASNARLKFADIFDGAVAGQPQLIQRRDGQEVVLVSRKYYESTKPNLKTYLLENGYSGAGEDEFDEIMRGIRGDVSGPFTPRLADPE